jgi:hypothetical protein
MNADTHTLQAILPTITAFSTAVTAVCALIVSIWQGITQRRHNRLSVRPNLRIDWLWNDVRDKTKVTVQLSNNGLGPAILAKVNWEKDGELLEVPPSETIDIITSAVPESKSWDFISGYTPSPRDPMSPGEKHALIEVWTRNADDTEALRDILKVLSVRISYCSMYEEPFELLQSISQR